MKFIVEQNITVKGASPYFIQWMHDTLVIDNPEYKKKERMGKWLGNTPRTLTLYERRGDEIIIPFGCLQEVYSMWGADTGHEWYPAFNEIHPFNYCGEISLYDYQTDAVLKAMQIKNGILVMPCGSGKTQCGLEIINRVGGRALWLTHTADLLNQSLKRAENVLGRVGAGTITAGKVNIGEGITFATVQTMCKVDLESMRELWDVIIVDECHHCAGTPTRVTQFYKVLSNLRARYKIGLTATPKRADGLHKSMFALLGGIIHEVPKDAVDEYTCPINVMEVPTGYQPDYDAVLMGDGTLNYAALTNDLCANGERFNFVLNAVKNLDGSAIVLGSRVEYLQRMCVQYNNETGKIGVCLSGNARSKETRKGVLRCLDNGEIHCIFATYQLAKEGLDVPNLRYIVFATPEKDETTIVQSVGRVGRAAEGKDSGIVVDFVDDFLMYERWSRTRRKYYKKLGATVY